MEIVIAKFYCTYKMQKREKKKWKKRRNDVVVVVVFRRRNDVNINGGCMATVCVFYSLYVDLSLLPNSKRTSIVYHL